MKYIKQVDGIYKRYVEYSLYGMHYHIFVAKDSLLQDPLNLCGMSKLIR